MQLGKVIVHCMHNIYSYIQCSHTSLLQIGDTLSTNDSGIISIQDSGIGRDVSESHGHSPYKASLRLMKEKIQTKRKCHLYLY